VLLGLLFTLALGPAPADLVVTNAHLLIVQGARQNARAFAVRDGHFVEIGDKKSVAKYIGPSTQVWDLEGRTVVPGFNDAHLHPSALYEPDSIYASVSLDPDHTPTIPDLIAALKHKAEITPKGTLIVGQGYQDTKLGRHPTSRDLDAASTDHPIIIRHSSGHLSVANGLAMQLSGVTRNTAAPSGGVIGHFDDGEPNGFFGESATGLLSPVSRTMPKAPEAEMRRGYRAQFDAYLAKGITSIGVAGTDIATLDRWESMKSEGNVPLRINVMIAEGQWRAAAERLKTKGPGDDRIRMASIKLFHGNSLSGHTCWVSQPYEGQPTYFGVPPARSQAALNDLVSDISAAGLQVCTHSNGDREINMVLQAYAEAQRRHPRPDARMRIEHCSIVTPELLKRIKDQKVMMIPHSYEWEHGDKMEIYGPARWEFLAAQNSARKMGIPFAGHSDSPVSAADPMLRIQCMVTRRSKEGKVYGASQRISPIDALRGWTLGGAYASFEEKRKGAIAPGMLADFVVLSRDPLHTAPLQLKDIRVERTVVSGKLVFDRANAAVARRTEPDLNERHAD
jgi:predicted amidohydrolase YtcJ